MQFYYGHHPMADYFGAMDNEFYGEDTAEAPAQLPLKDVGMSTPLGIAAQNVQGIYAKIRSGTGAIEIGFPGAVRGQRQAQTPGMYGQDQRQAIKELGEINEVKFTTHAAYGIMGMSGFTGDNPYNVWFQREQRKVAVDEVKRAIEFARDAAGGGSVVVHTGEVDRPISEIQFNTTLPDGRRRFSQFEEESDTARIRVVDERSGQVMQQVRKNVRVARPKWLTAEEYRKTEGNNLQKIDTLGRPVKEINDDDYVDYSGRIIPKDLWFSPEKGRVPIYSKKSGRFENELYDWKMIKEETAKRNQWLAAMKGKKVSELTDEEKITPDETYIRSTLETNEGHSRGWALQYGHRTDLELEQLKKLKKAKEYYKKIEDETPPEELWKIMRSDDIIQRMVGHQMVPPDIKKPSQILSENIKRTEREIEFARQASASQELQAEDSAETQKHMVNADKYAIREATKSYAEAAIHAMDNSVNPEKPVFIAMENIFPERYGGHPEELKILIENARKEMVARLSHQKIDDPSGARYSREDEEVEKDPALWGQVKKVDNPYYRGMPEEEAKKRAEVHIKATLDTGHLNLWRKYWANDTNKTPQENDADFKKWTLKEVEKLAEKKMVGNVHLTDNFGYQDDHLSPGQGNTPVNEIVNVLKKHGYDGAWTTEPGADASTDNSDFHGLMKAWRYFGSPIYGVGAGGGMTAPQAWGQVQYSYFGQNRPPQYIFGAYSPSNDWTLWSTVPME